MMHAWAEEKHVAARDQVYQVLFRARLPLSDEKGLQHEIARRFDAAGIVFEREAIVSGGVIDFLVCDRLDGRIGVEVKISGAAKNIHRQLVRYAAEPSILSLMLVTARPMALPPLIGGKRCTVVDLGRAWL